MQTSITFLQILIIAKTIVRYFLQVGVENKFNEMQLLRQLGNIQMGHYLFFVPLTLFRGAVSRDTQISYTHTRIPPFVCLIIKRIFLFH